MKTATQVTEFAHLSLRKVTRSQVRICTTWPSFPFICRLLFIIFSPKLVISCNFISIRIVLSSFYLLIFYFNSSQLKSDVCCLRWDVTSVVTIKCLQYIKIATPCSIKNNAASNLIWTSLKKALLMLYLLVHIVSVRRTYWKKKKNSWQRNSKSSGKSILRRPPKIALTVNMVSSFFKHFLLGRLRVRGLT